MMSFPAGFLFHRHRIPAMTLVIALAAAGCATTISSEDDADAADAMDAADADADADVIDEGCAPWLTECGGECVNLRSSHEHCGACNRGCEAVEVCSEGECVLECPAGFANCSGSCVDTENDALNCGGCGQVCPGAAGFDVTCVFGRCSVTLTGELAGRYDLEGLQVLLSGDVSVAAYNGTGSRDTCAVGASGCLEIHGRWIVLESGASVSASGRGYGGGGGGGGGGGDGSPTNGQGGTGGSGTAGGANGLAGSSNKGNSGSGGLGGGPFGGGGGLGYAGTDFARPAVNGAVGNRGGYAAGRTNGDITTNETLRMGSAGGGGAGGSGGFTSHPSEDFDCSGGGGGGGGSGGRGGGYIKLVATDEIQVAGTIITTGGLGGDGAAGQQGQLSSLGGRGGNGGNAAAAGASLGGGGGPSNNALNCLSNGVGGAGGTGGAGAGGGVLLKAPSVSLEAGAVIDARGSRNTAVNGGTVKIFSDDLENTGTVNAGRLCVGPLAGPCVEDG
jgi:hypothetical protein